MNKDETEAIQTAIEPVIAEAMELIMGELVALEATHHDIFIGIFTKDCLHMGAAGHSRETLVDGLGRAADALESGRDIEQKH